MCISDTTLARSTRGHINFGFEEMHLLTLRASMAEVHIYPNLFDSKRRPVEVQEAGDIITGLAEDGFAN